MDETVLLVKFFLHNKLQSRVAYIFTYYLFVMISQERSLVEALLPLGRYIYYYRIACICIVKDNICSIVWVA